VIEAITSAHRPPTRLPSGQREQGTGLGLDISYRIVVARHGGDLTVESEPGDTRFIVHLGFTERPSS
jgi:signal transduction histidine kinase